MCSPKLSRSGRDGVGGGARRVGYSPSKVPFFCASRMLTLLSYLVRVRVGVRVKAAGRAAMRMQCGSCAPTVRCTVKAAAGRAGAAG